MKNDLVMNAYILTGGESRRFGSPKCAADLAGKPVFQWIADNLEPVSNNIFQVGKSPVTEQLPFVRDNHPVQCPLNGILTALDHAEMDWIFIIACDMPLIQPELIQKIRPRLNEQVQAMIFRSGDQDHYTCGNYHRSALDPLYKQYQREEYALKRIAGTLTLSRFSVPEKDEWQLLNCNTPEALVEAEKYVESKM